ncbi:hypothetical protein CPB97_006665 [Podila verticillata]|nr:hypothetical protein CPB97_006665 [Podila verticillata]
MHASSRSRLASQLSSLCKTHHRHLYRAPIRALGTIVDKHTPTTPPPSSSTSLSPRSHFDPVPQVSRINTHYCREPQLIMIEDHGILQGEMDDSRLLTRYLNVPFATVHERWQPATRPEAWRGIRDATIYGPMCPQTVAKANNLTSLMVGVPGPGFEFSERDCLNLNVFAPRCIESVPVICYIHGGGLKQGGNALPAYDATNIVKKSIAKDRPVIVVTINYRLGDLGASPPSSTSSSSPLDKIIWGLRDQKMALEWVRKNIHNFGGNPHEITLMGHSSGESSAGYHLMTSSTDQQLFKRAIMHSSRSGGENMGSKEASSSSSEWSMQVTALEDRQGQLETEQTDRVGAFTFMSDACLKHMTDNEKQAGFGVMDKWIDFAWGQDTLSSSQP